MTDLARIPVQLLNVADIEPSKLNPRKAFPEEKLRALGENLKTQGQLEAALVRPAPGKPGRYELANGERRWRACQMVGVTQIAAKVKELTDPEMIEIALAIGMGDNVESLTAIEEANGYAQLLEMRGWGQRQLAAHLGRAPAHVAQRIALINLPTKARAALEEGRIAARTAYYIASIPGDKARAEAAAGILNSEIHGGVMPESAALTYIRDHICRPLRSTPFDQKDATLVPMAGACATCRFRAGNNPEEYGDMFDPKKGGGVDRCMHPQCFEGKVAAHHDRVLEKMAVDGRVALSRDDNARVFAREEKGVHFASEYVAYNERPTPDLLKKEVSPGSVPTWRELTANTSITIYVGVHQDGHGVELVKRDEAVALADLSERRVFNESQVKRGTVAKVSKTQGQADSRAEEERAEKQARDKAERARKKKERVAAQWQGELCTRVTDSAAGGRPLWHGLAFWTCLYEQGADALSVEELAFVVAAVDPDGDEKTPARERLDAHSAGLPLPEFVALVVRILSAPRLLSEGVEGQVARAWLEATLVAEEAEEIDPEVALNERDGEEAEAAANDAAAAQAELDAAFADVMPGTSSSARSAIMGRYAKRVCGEVKLEEHLNAAEKRAIVQILKAAKGGRAAVKGSVKTAAEGAE